MHEQDVLFHEEPGVAGDLGIITLNRPQALNSLNHHMVLAMYNQLQSWLDAKHIKAVVIQAAEGRAFCAGGDIKLAYKRGRNGDPAASIFFRDEYQLNRLIFHFPKPYIALLNGVTMGGGVGVSIHGSHRVATENLLFAMPETAIGFFPDVGGTYFLPGLPGKIGFYLGLTGARLSADDCVSIGITQYKTQALTLPALKKALAETAFGKDPYDAVSNVIAEFHQPILSSRLLQEQSALDACFSLHQMEDIVIALQHSTNPLCNEAAHLLANKSPTSLKVTLSALHKGKRLDFDDCMRQEYRLTCHFLENHDFYEGIRALIIDKDRSPQWQPNRLDAVTSEEVARYFSPIHEELA